MNLLLNIKRIFTDMNGLILNKAAVPVLMQTKYPFYLFNNFDYKGGYFNFQKSVLPQNGTFLLYSYVKATGYNFLDFQLGNEINKEIKTGDMVMVFGDDPILPNFLCHIIVNGDLIAYGSFLQMENIDILFDRLQYSTDNENNWLESITLVESQAFGNGKENTLSPIAYRTTENYTQGFLEIPFKLKISNFNGIGSYIQFATDQLQLNFLINGNTDKSGARLYYIR